MKANRFEHFKFQPFIMEAINKLGFFEPTEIQEQMIPLVLKNASAIGQSQTGTGKTLAFVLPILEKVDHQRQEVQAVITAPTRELASQIYQQILKVTEHCSPDKAIMTRCYIGGTDKQRTIDKLKVQPHIVVGTPGRIKDLMADKALFIHTSEILVVDEADMMLDMGFIEDLDQVAAKMPEKLQMLVFSATIPEKLKPFLKKYMENPKTVHIQAKRKSAENLQHFLLPSKHRNKKQLVYDALVNYNPYLAIVFTNTKKMAEDLAGFLTEKGLKVGRVHGDLNPRERRKMMKQIQDLDYQYIVATDLASRGIDIEGISHIINYELPTDLDFYIHRVGRTARAGNSGIALTVYELSDEDALNRLEKMGIQFTSIDLKNNGFVEVDDRNKRKTRVRQADTADKKAKTMVKKPEKVKPGYKKKMKWEMDKVKKRERRIEKRKK